MSEQNGISFPLPKKIDPYYDRMIDLYKKKVELLEKDNKRLRKMGEYIYDQTISFINPPDAIKNILLALEEAGIEPKPESEVTE